MYYFICLCLCVCVCAIFPYLPLSTSTHTHSFTQLTILLCSYCPSSMCYCHDTDSSYCLLDFPVAYHSHTQTATSLYPISQQHTVDRYIGYPMCPLDIYPSSHSSELNQR